MANAAEPAAAPTADAQLESGTYEIIRNRLSNLGRELRTRLDQLNQSRMEVFGGIETQLLSTERITTNHNCVPRDMVPVGQQFLFGYNVHLGLKAVTDLSDVFAAYEYHDHAFHEKPLDLIRDEQFERDFAEIYRYYKAATFARFAVRGPHLHMVFRIGKSVSDVKTFKWRIEGDRLVYLDNRSEHEYGFPPQHEFEWIRTHRDLHRSGRHPHISIEDRVFVETVGGDLTIKIEDNTLSGRGIYEEDVENKDQTLDDAEIYYATFGHLILLKIRPYQEQQFRYFVFNEKIEQVVRLDEIEQACLLLPDDHGLIFANGYYLQDGQHKRFDINVADMVFEKRVQSPNGEDTLFIFFNREHAVNVLLTYNLIEQQVNTPNICHGYSFFENGEAICFKGQPDPQKHHAIQIWQTPFVGPNFVPEANTDSYLYKIGNRDVVRGMAECHEVLNLIGKDESYAGLYVDLVKKTGDILDSYFWLDSEDAAQLNEPLGEIRDAAEAAIGEFEKVVQIRKATKKQVETVEQRTAKISDGIRHRRFEAIDDFVKSLADLRTVRGEIISLRELRYVDEQLVDGLESQVAENSEKLAAGCVKFLLEPQSLEPYRVRIEQQRAAIDGLAKVTAANELEEQVDGCAGELEMLVEIVSNLKIDDATHRTEIIDNISANFTTLNQVRALVKKKKSELMSAEGIAEFSSQIKLLSQSVVNYLDVCDTPERCEEYLTRMMIQIEELEGRFAEFDEFVVQLSEKREEIYTAFENRKLALTEARNKKAGALGSAADRILGGIKNRVDNLESVDEINGYFAADLMIEKVRDLCDKLADLDDSVKVDDIQSRLKTIREDAVRQLKDRQELYVDGENIIRMGEFRFSVNVQALDLTTVLRDGELYLHLTGTRFFEKADDPELADIGELVHQEVVSENRDVYRGEYLAYQIFRDLGSEGQPSAAELHAQTSEQLAAFVQETMAPRYAEGYVKGVHDHDAALILRQLLDLDAMIGLLRYGPSGRALAQIAWHHHGDDTQKTLLAARLAGFGTLAQLFPRSGPQREYVDDLSRHVGAFVAQTELFPDSLVDEAGEYLFCQLASDPAFVVSRAAADLFDRIHNHLREKHSLDALTKSIDDVRGDPASAYLLARDWVEAFLDTSETSGDARDYTDEVATLLLEGRVDRARIIDASVTREVVGLVGSHPRVDGGNYHLKFNEFMFRIGQFDKHVVPRFQRFVARKKEIVDTTRSQMRLDEFRPRVLTSFVRNKLIDEVYLPLVGANLAKQIGVAGENKRTDLMGLLLLISPPGYGKTTLMEYIANRLGVIFMKINGPSIGHQVTSLDPAEATNAAAREEINKLNLALEMGDNVMLYLDDIQHCNPEFLQKFISLCDAQRKIEGVYKGQPQTYDLRGRKVCVVMAGNPYTESGDKFQIPDMLANRADTYNLGDIIGDSATSFEMSYLENTLTSNKALAKLASRSQKDVYSVIKMAETGSRDGVDFEGNYSLDEINEFVTTMRKLMRIRDVVLTVNQEYIRSAAQSDDYRTEPPFKLQGSYRNMNKMAEKVFPIMNDSELEALIEGHYENEAQTLTTGAEANLLKLHELLDKQTEAEQARWAEIKKTFSRNTVLKGVGGDDKFGQVIAQLVQFKEGLDSIRQVIDTGMAAQSSSTEPAAPPPLTAVFDGETMEAFREIADDLRETLAEVSAQEPATTTPAAAPNLPAVAGAAAGTPAVAQAPAVPKIDIINKVPRAILNVVNRQFKLMQDWMQPILAASTEQGAELQHLRESVDQTLDHYRVLIEKLETGVERSSGN